MEGQFLNYKLLDQDGSGDMKLVLIFGEEEIGFVRIPKSEEAYELISHLGTFFARLAGEMAAQLLSKLEGTEVKD